MIESDDEYFLSRDNDCHWYVIPLKHKEDWSFFLNLDSDDPSSWNVPEWADAIGGSPSLITFYKYKKA